MVSVKNTVHKGKRVMITIDEYFEYKAIAQYLLLLSIGRL